MKKLCPDCRKMYPAYSKDQVCCKECAKIRGGKALAKALAGEEALLSERTCAHCRRVLTDAVDGKAITRLPLYEFKSGIQERWCHNCVKWEGAKYGAKLVLEKKRVGATLQRCV